MEQSVQDMQERRGNDPIGKERRLITAPFTTEVRENSDGLTELHIDYDYLPYSGNQRFEAQFQLDLQGDGKVIIPSRMEPREEGETAEPTLIGEFSRIGFLLSMDKAHLRYSGWLS